MDSSPVQTRGLLEDRAFVRIPYQGQVQHRAGAAIAPCSQSLYADGMFVSRRIIGPRHRASDVGGRSRANTKCRWPQIRAGTDAALSKPIVLQVRP